MNKLPLSTALLLSVFIGSSFISLKSAKAAEPTPTKVEPFCKFTFVDHRGHSLKLSTQVVHASSTSLTFIFETGQKLIIRFTTLRPGHFVAHSARSKDPAIEFFPAHGHHFVPMLGALVISSVKPTITGNFAHLLSDHEQHVTLVAGTFSL
jgi:hypothetical protein